MHMDRTLRPNRIDTGYSVVDQRVSQRRDDSRTGQKGEVIHALGFCLSGERMAVY